MTTTSSAPTRNRLQPAVVKRAIWIAVAVIALLLVVLGTKVVPNDDPRAQSDVAFDPATFGAETFPAVRDGVIDRAVDAATLAQAIAEDSEAAAEEYSMPSSGGPVYSVTFTGVAGEGQSGIYPISVEGLPEDLLVRVQTGPAINGTDLRDATGDIQFGQFRNQIEFQNAAAALNEEVKTQVLADVDTAALEGQTVQVTGAFTLVNPAAWLVTPVELSVQ
jgi:predicted lipoprotein